MQTINIEITIPDALKQRFENRLRAYGGDTHKYVQEVIARDLLATSDASRQRLIDRTFEEIDRKYGEALTNLAK